MLQQTTVAAVQPYYARFLRQWPRVEDLAAAALDDVLVAWQGLGYYARARNLHACARAVVERHGGRFPDDEAALRALPGIGAYTAAAVAAIAFDRPTVPVDGNGVRVLSRICGIDAPMPAGRPEIDRVAQGLTSPTRSGDFAQALMDLGATLCTPRNPRCDVCPWREDCRAHCEGDPTRYPVKAAKAPRPVRHGVAFWAERKGAVLLRKRPASGLLGGMMEVPSTPWETKPWRLPDALVSAPLPLEWRAAPGLVTHTFTHFHLELTVLVTDVPGDAPGAVGDAPGAVGDAAPDGDGRWVPIADLAAVALPTVMRKVVAHALRVSERGRR